MREVPLWLDKRGRISEPMFCEQYLRQHPMKAISGRFYTVEGLIPDESEIKRSICDEITPYVSTGVAQSVDRLYKLLGMMAYDELLTLQTDRVHVANGTLFMDGRFSDEKEFCINRLPVAYCPDAPTPNRWLRFLSELLHEEDIPTLQEFLGYCLIPSTKGQKMMLMIGKGGEGKSRIGIVMKAILGESMNMTSIEKIETNQFARADLSGKLLMVDDDMNMAALPKTNYIKSIVTAECKMDLERKREQSFQGQLYVRFLCFSNGALTALHDRSDGFFRRQIVLTTRDKPADRVDDAYLVDKLKVEREGIFLWMLEGLRRLLAHDFHFTISDRARENIESIVRSVNNVADFLASEGYVIFRADYTAPTKHLYEAYKVWCDDNAEKPLSAKSFANYIGQNYEKYGLIDTDRILLSGNKRCRGYEGIGVLLRYPEL